MDPQSEIARIDRHLALLHRQMERHGSWREFGRDAVPGVLFGALAYLLLTTLVQTCGAG